MNVPVAQSGSVLIDMAQRFGMDPNHFELTVRATCSPKGKDARPLTREEFAAFLLVAREHRLNPLLREIYAFPAKGGGIVPVVGIDGWINMVNRHPQFDGMEFSEEHNDKGGLISTECCIWRKDRTRPTKVREHHAECWRDTDAWKGMPHRMLRHKALIQTARIAFGFAGIYDEEEAAVIADVRDVTPKRTPPKAPKQIEKVDQETGEITEVADVRGAGLDSSQTAHQRGSAAAASPGPSTKALGESGFGGDYDVRESKRQLAEAARDRSDEALASNVAVDPDKAFDAYRHDMARATEGDEADAIRDSYMEDWAMAWSREMKEDAAVIYIETIERIDTAAAHGSEEDNAAVASTACLVDMAHADSPEQLDQIRESYMTQWGAAWTRQQKDDASNAYEIARERISRLRPEDEYQMGPTPRHEPTIASEAQPAAATAKKPKTPPKAPKPASEAPSQPGVHVVSPDQYIAAFQHRFNAVKTVEDALALKAWWYASSSERTMAGLKDKQNDVMRDQWTKRLGELRG